MEGKEIVRYEGDGRLSVSCLLNRQASKGGGRLNVGYQEAITDIQPFRALLFMTPTDQNALFADRALNGGFRQNQPLAQCIAVWQLRASLSAARWVTTRSR